MCNIHVYIWAICVTIKILAFKLTMVMACAHQERTRRITNYENKTEFINIIIIIIIIMFFNESNYDRRIKINDLTIAMNCPTHPLA